VGHEQQGHRFGVVVQSDAMLPRSTVLMAPTSVSARAATFRPVVEVAGAETRVLVEHIGSVDVSRLGERVGRLEVEELWSVDDAIADVLGLS
jgi:mRNA interferase MazF